MARSTLDDFVLKDKLGSGSYGCVHRVIRKVDRQYYALKEIDLQGLSKKEQEECIKETQILSSVDSEYIIKYYDSFLEKGKLYICMEYAPGGNLHSFINRQKQKLPEELIWRMFIQMLLGLHHMHKRKVLHRDLKTLNVFLDDKLNIRLGDLGVAKILSTHTNFAQTVVGTPYYLSPEMCEDKPYDQKSDVWALGVSLYECCTQKHPFDADNQGALILKILRGKYPAVSGYSKELVDIVKACLTLDVRKRPDTAQLLGIKAVRDQATELGLEHHLPPAPQVVKPVLLGIAPHVVGSACPGALAGNPANPVGSGPKKSGLSAASSAGPPARQGIAASKSMQQRTSSSSIAVVAAGNARPASAGKSTVSPRSGTAAETAAPVVGASAAAGSWTSSQGDATFAAQQVQSLNIGVDAPMSGLTGGDSGPFTPVLAVEGSSEDSVGFAGGDAFTPTASDRSHHMRDTLETLRSSMVAMVGAGSFDALYMLVNMTADQEEGRSLSISSSATAPAGQPLSTQSNHLVKAVQKIIPGDKVAAVLPLLFKIMYLEAQLGDQLM